MRLAFACLLGLICGSHLLADGPADNNPLTVRRLPKLGIEVPAEKRAELESAVAKLGQSIAQLQERKDAKTRLLLPDVQVFHKGTHDALKYQEFHDVKELDEATKQLALGQERAEQLLRGEAPWTSAAGLVVRGYVSKIDGSVQPYGMVVPETYTDKTPVGYRCDIWLHGRGETMTELNFIKDRRNNPGTFTPPRTLVLHPYGRWNNAFKFAGEIDVLEALADAQRKYAIDEDRIAMRGFSMGGAGAWHMAVHYPDMWFAANPGAGFSETPQFLKVFQGETLDPKTWEVKLWNLYDCNNWAPNITQCPTVAYSGEDDKQKQAADVMMRALRANNMNLTHIVGKGMGHSYSPEAKIEVEQRLSAIDEHRPKGSPARVNLALYTLKYNRASWLQVDAIEEHWKRTTVTATRSPDGNTLSIETNGVKGLSIEFPPGEFVGETDHLLMDISIDGQKLRIGGFESDGSFHASLSRNVKDWYEDKKLVIEGRGQGGWFAPPKAHGLQGPIDDAFMDSFLMVKPTGKPWNEAAGKWSLSEGDRAIEQWRRHFRGEARVKNDADVTDDDIKNHNLVLWGDPGSNAILAKLVDKLPIQWSKEKIVVDQHGEFSGDKHALIAIYPNPLNPAKYVVLNSGFTFREYAHLNNARQVPMLPDWAVVDLTTPPNTVWPGKVVAADFFDEQWKLKKSTHK